MQNRLNILSFIQNKGRVRAEDLRREFGLSRVSIHKILLKLQEENKIQKFGTSPLVFYGPKTENEYNNQYLGIDSKIIDFINQNYLYVSPKGEQLTGFEGFTAWSNKTNQSVEKNAYDYFQRMTFYNAFKKNGLIDGINKLKNTFDKIGLNKLYYLDFYSIDRFGKTRLGQMLLYAKQSQDENLTKVISNETKPSIEALIKRLNITSIGFVPPTVRREVQFMKVLERNLNLPLTKLSIVKIKSQVAVPQKTLSKLEDRVENAKNSIIVNDDRVHQNILLIDDAVGSGSTLNETALQIREKRICKGKIYGLAIVGSFKGFDVISEV